VSVTAPGYSALDIVRRSLHHYAARGSFGSFSEVGARGSKTAFQFSWFRGVTFRVVFDETRRTLTFADVLPGVPPRSEMDRDLRRFVRSRSAPSVVKHRRFDLRRVGVTCTNRGGSISLVFHLKPRHIEFGVRRAVHLIHEILMDFLNDSRFVQYQVDHFRLDPELAS
jgi:hypothetical protein